MTRTLFGPQRCSILHSDWSNGVNLPAVLAIRRITIYTHTLILICCYLALFFKESLDQLEVKLLTLQALKGLQE